MSDDDWFERALRDLDHDEEDVDASSSGDADVSPERDADPSPDRDVGVSETDDDSIDGPDGAERSDPFGAGDDAIDDSVHDPPGGGSADSVGGDSPDTFGGDSSDPFDGSADPFEGGGTGDEFGFAEFGEAAPDDRIDQPTEFDDADLDSDIDRIDIGIEGLDEMILGGVPRRSLIATIGAAGTGKTTFGLQFLAAALSNGDRAVYITLEEGREAILSTAEEKGWPFREYAADGSLVVVALDPIEMANSLSSIRNDLSRLISEFGAERLVLDSVSLLEMMYDHPAKRRSEVFEFTRSLKEAGVTTLLTSEASEDDPYTSKHGIVEYLTDAVFVLQYVRGSDFQETRLAVEIQKIRDANHSRETKPYAITDDGIDVYRQANLF